MVERAVVGEGRPYTRREAIALTLLEATGQLPGKARHLLLLANAYRAAAPAGDERGERAARDMLLAAPLPDLSPAHQSVAAAAAAFQRDKLRPQREPAFIWLGEKDQHTALALAAVLRLTEPLAAANCDLRVRAEDQRITLLLAGAGAAQALAAAEERAALWREQLSDLALRVAEPGELDEPGVAELGMADGLIAPAAPAAPDGDLGGEPIAEASRRALRRFFDKLLAREEAVLKDEDSEDVHQMRVATRRLRAALQILAGVYELKLIRRYRKGLRRIAQSLGAVRDGDVFLEHVLAHRDRLPEPERASLEPLIAAATAERERARAALLGDLSSRRYRKFKRAFAEFLCTPGAGALPAPEPGVTERVRDFAGSAIWRRYELWRAYEVALPGAAPEALHAARIAGKRLRYTLEFFADALGPRAEQALEPLVALQENLGQLQDEVTAWAHVAALGLDDDAGAQSYLAARSAERQELLAELPRRWEKVDSATYRRRLFELIVKL
jgi:CHAD domain-containing protein